MKKKKRSSYLLTLTLAENTETEHRTCKLINQKKSLEELGVFLSLISIRVT